MPPDTWRPPRGNLIKWLCQANGLGRARFAAHEAMLFGSRNSWWGSRKARPLPHEGVDLCRYVSDTGAFMTLGPGARTPVACAGKVWAITGDDFIGRSIYVRHEGEGGDFFTAYAHVLPRAGLSEGDVLFAGEVLAALADPKARKLRICPHLHFSLMTFSENLPREKLRWATMGAGDDVRFHDPGPLLGEELILCEAGAEPRHWERTDKGHRYGG